MKNQRFARRETNSVTTGEARGGARASVDTDAPRYASDALGPVGQAATNAPQLLGALDEEQSTPSEIGRRAAGWRRFVLPLGDQVASALSNALLVLVTARVLSPGAFGAFAVAYTVFVLLAGALRGSLGHLVLVEGEQGSAAEETAPRASGATVVIGAAAGAAIVAIALGVGGGSGRALVSLAVVFPGLVVQDIGRHCLVAARRPLAALLNDSGWLVATVPAVLVAQSVGGKTPTSAILGWGIVGNVAAVVAVIQLRMFPKPRAGLAWLRDRRRLAGPFFIEFLTAQGTVYISLLGLAAVTSVVAVGAVQGAFLLLAPLTVGTAGAQLVLIPDAVAVRHDHTALRQHVRVSTAVILVISAVWVGVLALMPGLAGRKVLGATWPHAHRLVLPLGLAVAMAAAGAGPLAALRALRAARRSFVARVATSPATVLSIPFAAVWGVEGFCVGIAIGDCAASVALMLSFIAAVRTRVVQDRGGAGVRRRPEAIGIAALLTLPLVAGLLFYAEGLLAAVAIVAVCGLLAAMAWSLRATVTALWALTVLLAPMNSLRLSQSVAVSDLTLCGAAFLTLVISLYRADRPRVGGLLTGLGAVVIGGFIGSIAAPGVSTSIANLFHFALASFGCLVVMMLWRPRRQELRILMWAFLGGTSLSAVLGIFVLRTPVLPGVAGTRAQGLTSHPNHLALTCVLAIGLAVGLSTARRLSERVVAIALLPLLILAVVQSGSRAALVVSPIVILVALAVDRRAGRFAVGATVVGVAVALLLIGALPGSNAGSLGRLTGSQPTAGSNAARSEALGQSLDSYLSSPLVGAGFANAIAAHDIYLQVLVSGGPLAFVGFVVFFWRIVRRGARAADRLGRSPLRSEVAGLIAGVVGYLVIGLLFNALWDRYLWLYLGILATTPASYLTLTRGGRVERRRELPAGRGVGQTAIGPTGATTRLSYQLSGRRNALPARSVQ